MPLCKAGKERGMARTTFAAFKARLEGLNK
jgi:hypothetical protein